MKINVTENKVSIKEEQILNENEYNIHKIQFDFSSEYTDDLVKVALFSIDNHTYKKIISNNECDIPPEVLTQRGYSILGVYAYKTEQDTLVLRYSPSPTRISVYDGSYKAEAENSEPITPSEIEQYQQILQNSLQQFQNQYNVLVEETEGDIQAIEDELQRKVDEGYFDGEDGYTPQKGTDYFTQEDIDEIENGVKTDLEETVLVDYSLITETGSKIELSINTTNYKLTAILKDKNNATICTSNEIDLPLETMVVNATYDNTTKKIILTLQNGTTVEFSVADLVSGLVSETQLQTILANYYTQTEINNLLANKVDKVAGKGLSTNDFTDEYKEQVDTNTEDIEDIQEEQTEQNTEIGNLQAENKRIKSTFFTTTGTGQTVTLNKTAEMEFVKPPLPMGNSEQEGESSLDNEVPIVNITGNVEVVIQNRDLFNINDFAQKASSEFNVTDRNGEVTLSRASDTTYKYELNCKENTVYTLQLKVKNLANNYYIQIRYEDNTSTDIYSQNATSDYVNVTKTSDSNKTIKYFEIQLYGWDNQLSLKDIQLEEGSTATSYIPHQEQKFTFPLGNEKLMLGDYLADDGIHHVRGQDIFDGSEDEVWEKIYGSIENGIALYSVNKNHKQVDGLSDKFVMRNSLSIWYNGEGVTTKWRTDKIGFMINGERINNDYSISAIKNLMNNNPVTVEYELEEEVIVPYTSEQQTVYNAIKQALSYEEQTNISSNQNAIFNVEAYLDTKVILSEKVDKIAGKGLSTNDFTNTYKNSVDSNTSARHTHTNKTVLDGIASSDITNWNGKQNETDNSLNTTNKTITGAINEVYSIARGANQAVSYSNYQAMITAFNSLANDIYNVGQNVMIVTLQVPDLWISGIESTSVPYTYTTDEAFTTALATNGYVQVGYYKLSALETQKVDLTDYEQNTNKTTTISSSSTNAQYPSAKAVYDYIQSLDGDEVSY